MTFSSAYLFAKQITAGEVPGLDVVWFNSKSACPMQSFGNNSNPFIRRNSTGSVPIEMVSRRSENYPEPAAGFIGCDATPIQFSDVPWELYITMLDSNEQETNYQMRYRAVQPSDNSIGVYCELLFTSGGGTSIVSQSYSGLNRYSDDQSCQFYLFTGAGAFFGNRAGSTLATGTTYIGVIAAGVNSSNTRFVDISGAVADLTKILSDRGIHLPYDRLSN
ncbi:MAG: hypothetical protein J6O73_16585 [Lachnospiraceae bacterium]|nr:hypothetical protein [Lachnospiraceae bacterium]